MKPTQTQESLPQLEEELDLILYHLDSEDPEEKELAEDIFSEFLPRLENKIDGYIKAIKWRENLAKFQREEAKRLQALAHRNQDTVKWLKERLQQFMENRVEQLGKKGKKLEGQLCKISLCQNGGKPPVWIDSLRNEKDFPDEYVETVTQINRQKLIEDAIDYGEVLDEQGKAIAKVMPRGKHLRIS